MGGKRLSSEQNHKQVNRQEFSADFLSKRFGIYLLGAGFSQPAGLPLAKELWLEILRRGLEMPRNQRAGFFRDDLETFIKYKKVCDCIELSPDEVNFEEFLAFLDIEHYLGLRGSDTWSVHGNEAQVVVKTLIGEILTKLMPSIDRIPEIYLQFAKILRPNDIVLTFNYDILLERALEVAGVPFRLFLDRHKPDPLIPGRLVIDSRDEVMVFKLHGSIDWFDRSTYAWLEQERIRNGFGPGGPDLIFQRPEKFGAVPLLAGPHDLEDPLHHIYRVRDIERLYSLGILFHSTPSLLNPSSTKILYSKMVKDFWLGLGRAGVLNFCMAVIGFSLPSQDEYARQVIYRLITNYQSTYWGDTDLPFKKTPLVLIDYRTSPQEEQEYRKRYRFVDWDRAVTYFCGFNEEAIEHLGQR